MFSLSNTDRTRPGNSGSRGALIQACDDTGNWFTNCITPQASPGGIQDEMRRLKQQYPNWRVRAIDEQTGSVIDFWA